jgi:hypothetical protein
VQLHHSNGTENSAPNHCRITDQFNECLLNRQQSPVKEKKTVRNQMSHGWTVSRLTFPECPVQRRDGADKKRCEFSADNFGIERISSSAKQAGGSGNKMGTGSDFGNVILDFANDANAYKTINIPL